MNLLDGIYNVSVEKHRTTKGEVVEAYKEKYGAKWRVPLVNKLAEITGKKPSSLQRRFDPGTKGGENRLKQGWNKSTPEFERIGKDLPPKIVPPEGGYHIWGIIYVTYSPGQCGEREVDERITGDAAQQLLDMVYDDVLQAVLNAYQSDGAGDIDFPGPNPGDCGSPDLHVEAF